jgi:phosphoglycerate dehydrogenase-like enzyme
VRVLVFPRLPEEINAIAESLLPPGHVLIQANPDEPGPELVRKVHDADAVVWATTATGVKGGIPEEVWRAGGERIKFIQTVSAGYDEIDLDRARASGIPVCTNGGANAISVAEHTIMLMLALYRRLTDVVERTRAGKWRPLPPGTRFYEIAGKTVGIVGMGNIGREVAKRLSGWSAELIYFDVFRRSPAEEASLGVTYVPLDDLFARADVITLHAPLLPETARLVNAARLARMKPTSILVNAARGGLIDQEALLQAVEAGQILGAALDTVDPEPPPPEHPLLHHPRIIVTPHVAGPTWDSWPRRFANAYANLERVSRGERPAWIVPELT